MMLEGPLTAALVALVVSISVSFLMDWHQRVQLRRLRFDLDDVLERLMKENNRKAAAVSVARRQAAEVQLHPADAAAVARIQQPGARGDGAGEDFPAWFDPFTKK
jgi:cytochrome c biogenesis factor